MNSKIHNTMSFKIFQVEHLEVSLPNMWLSLGQACEVAQWRKHFRHKPADDQSSISRTYKEPDVMTSIWNPRAPPARWEVDAGGSPGSLEDVSLEYTVAETWREILPPKGGRR